MPPDGLDQRSTLSEAAAGRRPLRAVNALLLACVMLPVLVFGLIATYDRSQTLAAVERELLATLDMLHGHAENVFQLQALELGATDDRLRGQSDAEVLAAAAGHHAYLRSLQRYAGETLRIVVFGADGRPLVDSDLPVALRDVVVTDQEFFRWHQEHPGSDIHVSGPARGRADGKSILFVSMRRSSANGAFTGVLTVAVELSTFVGYWNRATPDRDAAISLVRDDGVILVRRPRLSVDEPVRVQAQQQLARMIEVGVQREVVRVRSPLDGIDRLVAYRSLDNFPVFIIHGISMETALAPWWRRLLVYGGFAVAVGLALSSLATLAKRRAQALQELSAHLEQRVEERTAEIRAGEARLRLLAREVDHRAKNALAVVQATLRLTPKSDAAAFAQAIEGRVFALARVQTLLSKDRWRGASLHALLSAELAPFVTECGKPGMRAQLDGPSVLLPPAAAQPLAMVAHELATNAVKHGALSGLDGQVTVSWRIRTADGAGDTLALRWVESGGPPVAGPPARRGFGTRMLDSLVRRQLGGTLTLRWPASGFVCEIEVLLSRLAKAVASGDVTGVA
jgi:two-component sensor histidine kinase